MLAMPDSIECSTHMISIQSIKYEKMMRFDTRIAPFASAFVEAGVVAILGK